MVQLGFEIICLGGATSRSKNNIGSSSASAITFGSGSSSDKANNFGYQRIWLKVAEVLKSNFESLQSKLRYFFSPHSAICSEDTPLQSNISIKYGIKLQTDEKKKLRHSNCDMLWQNNISLKSCRYAVVELLPSSNGIAIVRQKKRYACPPVLFPKVN
jgi:hypothetical protein